MHRKSRLVSVGVAAIAIATIGVACAGGAGPATPAAKTAPPAATKPATTTPIAPAAGQGDANAGKQLITAKGCASCHVVPGVPEAKGTIGPNLGGFASRPQIAATLPNNPENLTKWLKNPPAVKPGTQMPSIGLSDKEVADISAFLSTLK